MGHAKIVNFMGIINLYSTAELFHFRLERSTVLYIIEIYKAHTHKETPVGRPPLSAELAICMYLWYMANTVTFRQLANLFGIAKSAAWRSVNYVAAFLTEQSPNYIQWPTTQQEISRVVRGFEGIRGIPGIIGAIDGTHIAIKGPQQNKQDYCNRKKYYSISLQLVVDSKKRILDVYCGEPGTMHDAKVLRKSGLYHRVMGSPQTYILPGTFMIGDSSYPCKDWLVPPYKDNGAVTNTQKKFNKVHSSARIVVENAIGLLKTRFRRLLHFTEQSNIPLIVNITCSACVLHNICLMTHDELFPQHGEIYEDDQPPILSEDAETKFPYRREACPGIVTEWNFVKPNIKRHERLMKDDERL